MVMKWFWMLFFLLFRTGFSASKSVDSTAIQALFKMEQRVANPSLLMLSGATDSIRHSAAWRLFYSLDTMLQMDGAAQYAFDSLKNKTVSILQPKDEKFRIFTFNMVTLSGKYQNFGYLEVKHGNETEIFPLLDTAKKPLKDYLSIELETDQWLGALYYEIVPFKVRRKKAYMLIGYDGSTIHSNKKVLDILWFDKKVPVFGMPVFKESEFSKKPAYRVVYEFHNDSRMLLRYEDKRKIVVLDKLNPAFPEAVNDFYYYIPTGDYDYFKLDRKGFWVKDALENFDLGQGKEPKGPTERPKPPVEEEKK